MPASNPATRSPSGTSSPVLVYLTPQERLELERVARLEMRSLSATARMLLHRGRCQYRADTAAAHAPPIAHGDPSSCD